MAAIHAIREAAVAGEFYPANADELRAMVLSFLRAAEATGAPPKAMILPHAGYVYSGPVAAVGYAHLIGARDHIRRAVILGPSHFVAFDGLAASGAEAFATPLGLVALDHAALDDVLKLPQAHLFDTAHAGEHSIEVHLPFLQVILDDFAIVPFAVGDATTDEVGAVLERLWGGPETVIIVSSDLSHDHDYETARRLDLETTRDIEELREIGWKQACGSVPINGLLRVAARRRMRVRTADLRNSADTAGPRDHVVGYGACLFEG
jgi:AmmeMemoRadiSam system protein B